MVENLLLHHQHDIHFEISALKVFYKKKKKLQLQMLKQLHCCHLKYHKFFKEISEAKPENDLLYFLN